MKSEDLVKIDYNILNINEKLVFNIFDSRGVLLLHKGVLLKDFLVNIKKHINNLHIHKNDQIFLENYIIKKYNEVFIKNEKLDNVSNIKEYVQEKNKNNTIELNFIEKWENIIYSVNLILDSNISKSNFEEKVFDLFFKIKNLLEEDKDFSLFILFYKLTSNFKNYSQNHSLFCSVLSYILSKELKISNESMFTIFFASFAQNISIIKLQNELVFQKEPLSDLQKYIIQNHAKNSVKLLVEIGVQNEEFFNLINQHHSILNDYNNENIFVHIIQAVDIYSASLTPRKHRIGLDSKNATERAFKGKPLLRELITNIGLCPPGTYVKLKNQQIALVIRNTNLINLPIVTSVINQNGMPISIPSTHLSSNEDFKIVSALPNHLIKLNLDNQTIINIFKKTKNNQFLNQK